MTKDYKNLGRKKSADASPLLQSALPFITGLSVGLFIAFIVYLKEHQSGAGLTDPELVIEDKSLIASDQVDDAVEKTELPEPQFDFYQILPNMEVNVSEWETEPEKKAEPITAESGVYILQVGSFEQYEAADEVKAKLALLGVNADIQRVVINGREVRHRVRVGPYEDPARLQEARDRLLANNLDFMLLKLKVEEVATTKPAASEPPETGQ